MILGRFYPDRYALWESCSFHILGDVMFGLGISMLPSLIFAIINHEDIGVFLYPIMACLLVALICMPLFRLPEFVKPVEGLSTIGMVWLVCILVGALPFMLAGMTPIDSVFESASGFTTTGATVMEDIEAWPTGILMWRSISQWVGGILTILIFLFILPMIGFGGRTYFGNEMSGSGSKNLSVRMKDAAEQFSFVYAILTLVLIIILLLLGVNGYESICMACSTISTGGFMCTQDSLVSYSIPVKIAVAVFMFLGGTNFYLHFKAVYQHKSKYLANEEFVIMCLWLALSTTVIYVLMYQGELIVSYDTFSQVVDIAFNVVSAGTTTGFVASDYTDTTLWTSTSVAILFMLAMVGGASGSTAGGIKISRLIIVFRYVKNGLGKMLHPRGVYDVKIDGISVDDDTIMSSITVVFMFLFTTIFGAMLLMMCGTGFEDSIARMIGCLTSFGPAIGEVGPLGSYENMNWYTKLFLSFIMWIGRLEIVTGLILLTPGFWKEYIMTRRKRTPTGIFRSQWH